MNLVLTIAIGYALGKVLYKSARFITGVVLAIVFKKELKDYKKQGPYKSKWAEKMAEAKQNRGKN